MFLPFRWLGRNCTSASFGLTADRDPQSIAAASRMKGRKSRQQTQARLQTKNIELPIAFLLSLPVV